jgi:hypothetical protein
MAAMNDNTPANTTRWYQRLSLLRGLRSVSVSADVSAFGAAGLSGHSGSGGPTLVTIAATRPDAVSHLTPVPRRVHTAQTFVGAGMVLGGMVSVLYGTSLLCSL